MNKFKNYRVVATLTSVVLVLLVSLAVLPSIRPVYCTGDDPQCEVLKERITRPRSNTERNNRSYYCSQMKDRQCPEYKTLCEESADTGRSGTSRCGLGRSWDDTESGHQQKWTRKGESNVFTVESVINGKKFTAEQTITISGSSVKIDRYEASDDNHCKFTGTIQSDGVTVSGSYTCNKYNPTSGWEAKINCH